MNAATALANVDVTAIQEQVKSNEAAIGDARQEHGQLKNHVNEQGRKIDGVDERVAAEADAVDI